MSSESLLEIQSTPRVKKYWISWVQKADTNRKSSRTLPISQYLLILKLRNQQKSHPHR